MLACARIGAIHSVVFGGFASNELASRIDDSKAKLLVTASCGFEPGRTVEYKPLVDEAIKLANHKKFYPFYKYLIGKDKNENINYVQLNESIDEYLAIENEIFYTFINDEDFNHFNIDENIDDYLEIEIDL